MSVRAQILEDIKVAMKAGENFKRDTLRTLNSALKQVEIDKRIELSDEMVFSILQSEIKKRNDSYEQYKNANRDDLADKEFKEIEIISGYLPKQLSDEELNDSVKKIINKNGFSKKDMGLIMKKAKEEFGAKVDGKRLSECVKNLINNL